MAGGSTAMASRVLDLQGRFVIPPLGDAHTHNLDGEFRLASMRDAYVAEGTFYVQVLTNTTTGAAQVRSRFDGPCSLDVVYANGGLTPR
jgi:imidazolonepropionase-like amidohydrolase